MPVLLLEQVQLLEIAVEIVPFIVPRIAWIVNVLKRNREKKPEGACARSLYRPIRRSRRPLQFRREGWRTRKVCATSSLRESKMVDIFAHKFPSL